MHFVCLSRGLYSYKSPLFFNPKLGLKNSPAKALSRIKHFARCDEHPKGFALWKPTNFCVQKFDKKPYFLHQLCCTEITLNPGNPNIMNLSAQFSITLDTNRCVILGVTMLHSVGLLSLKQYALDFAYLRL